VIVLFIFVNKLMKRYYTLSILLASLLIFGATRNLHAQESVRDLQAYMAKLRTSPYETVPTSVWKDTRNELKLLNTLIPYYEDTVKNIRQKAFYVTKRIGQSSKDAAVQRLAIDGTLRALKEKDTGISGNALEALTGFNRANFSVAAKDTIGSLIKSGAPHLDKLLRLAGFLGLQNRISQIQSIANGDANTNIKWAARLALARMGDREATEWIVNKLNNAQIGDDFVYDVVPELVYTRQPQIFDFLEKIINSDEQNCHSSNPDSEKKILCGYRVMEQIAPAIKDFPVKTNESGDLNVSEYGAALLKVRTWLASNSDYAMNVDIY
jgi:hypothetical protein